MSIFVALAMCVILRKFFPTTRLRHIHVYFLKVLCPFLFTCILCILKYLFIWLHWILVVAHGILFPDQGLNPGSLLWECRVSVTGPSEKSLFARF